MKSPDWTRPLAREGGERRAAGAGPTPLRFRDRSEFPDGLFEDIQPFGVEHALLRRLSTNGYCKDAHLNFNFVKIPSGCL